MKIKKILKYMGNIVFYIMVVCLVVLSISTIKEKQNHGKNNISGYGVYRVLTGSMSPTIKQGSLVIVKETNPQDIKPSDVITFGSDSGNLTTHRVVQVENNKNIEFVTKGDANNVIDPMKVSSDNLVGKVVFHIPIVGAFIGFIQQYPIIIVVLLIAGFLIRFSFNNIKDMRKK